MKDLRKFAGYFLILLLVVNMIVFALNLISVLLFWAVIVIIAIVAYSGLMKKR